MTADGAGCSPRAARRSAPRSCTRRDAAAASGRRAAPMRSGAASIRTDPRISLETMQKPGEFGPFKFLWKMKLEHDPNGADGADAADPARSADRVPRLQVDRVRRRRRRRPCTRWTSTSACRSGSTTSTTRRARRRCWRRSPSVPGGLTAALSRPTADRAAGARRRRRRWRPRRPIGRRRRRARQGRVDAGDSRPGAWRRARRAPAAARRGAGRRRARCRDRRPRQPAARPGRPAGGRGAAAEAAAADRSCRGDDAAYVVGSDGYLHALNVQNGWDSMTPALFLPANTRAAGLIVATSADGGAVAYAATTRGCGSQPDGVWAMDLASAQKTVTSFQAERCDDRRHRRAGVRPRRHRLRRDDGRPVAAVERAHRARAEDVEAEGLGRRSPARDFGSSPLVFQSKDKDIIAAAGGGKLFLFDSGVRWRTVRSRPAPSYGTADFDAGALASWQDAQGVRWIAVPVVARDRHDEGRRAGRQAGARARLDLARDRRAAAAAGHQRRAVRGIERQPRRAGGALRARRRDRQGSVEQRAGR